jgi:hypothetical protein
MILSAQEYDVGSSLHLIKCQQASASAHKEEQIPREERCHPTHFSLKFKILNEELNVLNIVSLRRSQAMFLCIGCMWIHL